MRCESGHGRASRIVRFDRKPGGRSPKRPPPYEVRHPGSLGAGAGTYFALGPKKQEEAERIAHTALSTLHTNSRTESSSSCHPSPSQEADAASSQTSSTATQPSAEDSKRASSPRSRPEKTGSKPTGEASLTREHQTEPPRTEDELAKLLIDDFLLYEGPDNSIPQRTAEVLRTFFKEGTHQEYLDSTRLLHWTSPRIPKGGPARAALAAKFMDLGILSRIDIILRGRLLNALYNHGESAHDKLKTYFEPPEHHEDLRHLCGGGQTHEGLIEFFADNEGALIFLANDLYRGMQSNPIYKRWAEALPPASINQIKNRGLRRAMLVEGALSEITLTADLEKDVASLSAEQIAKALAPLFDREDLSDENRTACIARIVEKLSTTRRDRLCACEGPVVQALLDSWIQQVRGGHPLDQLPLGEQASIRIMQAAPETQIATLTC